MDAVNIALNSSAKCSRLDSLKTPGSARCGWAGGAERWEEPGLQRFRVVDETHDVCVDSKQVE